MFVIILWTGGGSNFVDGIDVALLCIIQISFCYINITFIFQTFNSLATWVFTHTTVMSNVRYWPIALTAFIFCFGQKRIHHKFVRSESLIKYFIWQCKIISVNAINPPFKKISLHIGRQWEWCFEHHFLKCLQIIYKINHLLI